MKKRASFLAFFLAFGIAALPLAAQDFDLSELVLSGRGGIPCLDVPEPFPWGLEPSDETLSDFKGNIAEVGVEATQFSYPFGSKQEKSGESRGYTLGAGQGSASWALGGVARRWKEGETSYFWEPEATYASLVAWKGGWGKPDSIAIYREGKAEPSESWTKLAGPEESWSHETGENATETWIRRRSGAETLWTCYDPEGKETKLLAVAKDAKGAVSKVECWESPDKRLFELSVSRGESASAIKASSGSVTMEAKFIKGSPSIGLKYNSGEEGASWELKYALDASGRLVEATAAMGGKTGWKLAIVRDANGNPLSMQRFEAVDSFGRTSLRESWREKYETRYLKQGEKLPELSRPPELEAWLAGAEDSDQGTPLAEAEDKPANVGKWEVSIEKDPLTDARTVIYYLPEAGEGSKAFSDKGLCIRKEAESLEVYIAFDEILEETSDLALRFDADPPIYIDQYRWNKSTDDQAAFLKGYIVDGQEKGLVDFILLLSQKKSLYAQIRKYDDSIVSARFDLEGFMEALDKVSSLEDLTGRASEADQAEEPEPEAGEGTVESAIESASEGAAP